MPAVLYKRQREILEYIKDFIKKHHSSPTLLEIAAGMNLSSPATIYEHLTSLERKGLIKRTGGKSRSIEIIDQELPSMDLGLDSDIPLLGFIAAGAPLEPYTDPHATFPVPKNLLPIGKTCFVLQVKGDSMIDDGIYSGDYVVIVKQEFASDGEIVVALLDNGLATLKKFFKELNQIRLEPANSKMQPIFATNVRIQGKLLALIRKYG